MKIASKIVPCPITEAVMEVRFESSLDDGAIFGIIYNQIKNEFEKTINLPILRLPYDLRKNEEALKFLPYYRVESKEDKNTLIQIGPKVFSVIVTNEYPGWDDFLLKIEYGLQKLYESEVVTKVTRFSLRYINFFNENILLKSNLSILLNKNPLDTTHSVMRIEIQDGDFLNILNISAPINKNTASGIIVGSTIDIDTVFKREVPDFFEKKGALLSECHKSEKKLFFDLLSDEYEKNLKEVTYV